jgi:hypothetical protein
LASRDRAPSPDGNSLSEQDDQQNDEQDYAAADVHDFLLPITCHWREFASG